MRPGFAVQGLHYTREAMTDITLGLLQDTGWYVCWSWPVFDVTAFTDRTNPQFIFFMFVLYPHETVLP